MTTLAGELELRADPAREAAGLVTIRLQPWRALANDRPEAFAAGSLEWRGGIPLSLDHDGAPRLLLQGEDNGERVVLSGRLPDSPDGRALRGELAERPHASVEFRAAAEHREHGVRIIDRAQLVGVSAVRRGAYRTTGVEIRADDREREAALRWL